ncbi:hypothetical protein MBLNU459_g1174t1 [Dothideomycetes sp. NU459]
MHFNTLISTLLSASIAISGVAGSDISERATKKTTAADTATLQSVVTDTTAFCKFWQATTRPKSPITQLSAAQINNVCANIITPTTAITTCVASDLAKLKAAFTEPQAFCNFYAGSPRVLSPFTTIDATALIAVCKYCLPPTSSSTLSSVKSSSTAFKSSSKSSSYSSSSKSSSKSSFISSSSATSIKSSSSKSSSSVRSSGSATLTRLTSSTSASTSDRPSSSLSLSSSVSSSASLASSTAASFTKPNQGYLWATDSGTSADGTALEGFLQGSTDVGFELSSFGYGNLGYTLDNSTGYMYLGTSGVLLSGATGALSANKLSALPNNTANWTPLTCAIDNSTSSLSCSYKNKYNTLFNVFQLSSGTSNGATVYFLQLAPSTATTSVTMKALKSYSASSSSATESSTATVTASPTTVASATTTSQTSTTVFPTTCNPVPTGTFSIYAKNATSDYKGAVGKPLRSSYSNYAAFYLTETEDYPVLDFTYDPSTAFIKSTTGDNYLQALTAALVETGVAVTPLSSTSYTPLQCGIAHDCSMLCNYTTAYPMNYTIAQIFNVLDLQYNTNNIDDFYTLEMNQYGLAVDVILTVVPHDD